MLQGVSPPEHVHEPFAQLPPTHVVPQEPQLLELVCVFTHWPLHGVWFGGQTHCPPEQMRPPVQTLPQEPQFVASLCVSTH